MRAFCVILLLSIPIFCVIDVPSELESLSTDISRILKHPYLQKTTDGYNPIVKGIMWGMHRGLFVSLPVRLRLQNCKEMINVIFKVSTGSALTTLTKQAKKKLLEVCPGATSNEIQLPVFINQRKFTLELTIEPENELNILGSDFLHRHSVKLTADYAQFSEESFKLDFEANKQTDDL